MAKKDKSDSGDYEVGRGRPPKRTQFKKGQSGNPSGRKAGSVNFKTLIQKVASTEIPVNDNGTERRVSLLEGVLLRQAQEALRGNNTAAQTFLGLCQQHLPAADPDVAVELPSDDEAILRRALGRTQNTEEEDDND